MTINLSNVEFSYPNSQKKRVIGIDYWTNSSNQNLFIHGASGCGKSTLLHLVSGLLSPCTGSIDVLGEQLEKLTQWQRDRFRANNIGCIFQQLNLVQYLTAIDNVKLAHYFSSNKRSKPIKNHTESLLDSLGICSEDWHRPVSYLSLGQQQRVAIARALVNKPKLLIADEPTSSLDELARDNFMNLLSKLCENNQTSLLFVSHDTRLKKHFNATQSFSDINNQS